MPQERSAQKAELGETILAILREHRIAQDRERARLGEAYDYQDLVFALPTGQPFTPWNFGAAFDALLKRAGLRKIRLHDLRDTHASLLA